MNTNYSNSVFINCPFDEAYSSIFKAVVFTIFDCGYIARSAREVDDSSEVRIDKILKIISQCKYGIHDISRTEPDEKTNLPRFNMPLELGIFLGAKRFGPGKQKRKICLILDRSSHRFQSFISDIAGQDIQSHNNEESEAVKVVRNWMRTASGSATIPGGTEILRRYRLFRSQLPIFCEKLKLTMDEMVFNDYTAIVWEWLKLNP